MRPLLKFMSVYPPYLGAGVRVAHVSDDVRTVVIELAKSPLTQNFMGTQFGGSIYAMCDPWFMVMLFANLGDDYIVWDKAASVRFLKPGRTLLRATFTLDEARVNDIRQKLDTVGKCEPEFQVEVKDESGLVVAVVDKVLHAHKPALKPKKPAAAPGRDIQAK